MKRGAKKGLRIQRVAFSSFFNEIDANAIIDIQKVMGVFASILLQLSWEGSNAPVRQLVLLVGQNLAVCLQQIGETERLHSNCARSLTRIEQVDNVEAEVTLEPVHVRITTMEDFDNIWIVEDCSQVLTDYLL